MNGVVSPSWEATVDGADLVGKVAPLPLAASAKVAYAVIADRARASSAASDATNIILMLTLVFALVVLGYGFMVGNSIVKPIEQIEEGVLAVINGNTDVRLDTTNPDLGGLAYRINQLLNVFTGVSEGESEDAEGRVSNVRQQDWKDSAFTDAGQVAAAAAARRCRGAAPTSPSTIRLSPSASAPNPRKPTTVACSRSTWPPRRPSARTSTFPKIASRSACKGNEQALVKKHGVRNVRFVVQKSGTQVNLQPVLIR